MTAEQVVRLCIVAAALATMIAMSAHADRRFASLARLPMQWSVSGTVNWSAPRRLALSFVPLLAAAILLPTALATTPARPGQEALLTPILLAMAGLFVATHALHLWLVARWSRRDGR